MPTVTPKIETPATRLEAVELPEGLRHKFDRLERRLWKVETLDAVFVGIGGLTISYASLFVSDRLWDTPVGVRCLITLAGVAAPAWALTRWTRDWVWRRRDRRALAVLVQKRFRKLGDRLLGIVELADEKKRPAYFSPALYRAAIAQVAAEAKPYDFCEAVNASTARKRGAGVVVALGVSLTFVLLIPAASWNSFLRWSGPLASIPRYTLVVVDGLAETKTVPHGESFQISARVSYRSFWRPSKAKARFANQSRLETLVGDQQVHFDVPGQTRAGPFTIRIGDARSVVNIQPAHRPALKNLAALIQLPDYLQYPVLTQKVETGTLTLVEGSRVSFAGSATRELESAHLAYGNGETNDLPVDGPNFRTASVLAPGIASFAWRDQLGLRNAEPWRLMVETTTDSAPVMELLDVPREISMLESEVLLLKAQAQDDFGVRELGLVWAPGGDWASTNSAPHRAFKVDASSPREKKLVENFGFSPTLLKVAPDSVVEVKLYARDFLPGREPVDSVVYRIHVLGNERHAEMVRQQLESLQARLEEITRLEEKIAAGTRELTELTENELAGEQQDERLNALEGDQELASASLEALSREGTKSLREAMRNPLVPEETLRDWTQNLQKMQQLSQNQMKQAAQSLKSAQGNPQSRPEDVAKALEKQEEALEALEQMQSKVNKELDQLHAMTLAQRLRKLGTAEKELEGRIQQHVGETIGLLPKELPDRFRRINAAVAEEQGTAHQEAQTLQGEISRFFERSQRAEYGEVNKEMTEARTSEELEKVTSLIQENIAMEAMQNLAAWSERFAGWAEKLDPKRKDSDAGGGSGSGEGAENDMAEKLMMTLLGLLRLRESETNLREQTRLLEQRKDDVPIYLYNAELLVGKERESMQDLYRIQGQNPLAMLQPVIVETFESMKTVEGHLTTPETGQVTRDAETKTIETISDAINLINEQVQQSSSQSGSSSAASEEIAFLMQMMAQARAQQLGMEEGQSGGGSQAGGSTDQRPAATVGDASGKSGEGRDVQKASGFSGGLPMEFREALENYFNALEKHGE